MTPDQLARLPAALFEIGKLIGSDLDPGQLLSRISELVTTKIRNAVAKASRMMSLVRLVSGCSKLPETAISRPSTRIMREILSDHPWLA